MKHTLTTLTISITATALLVFAGCTKERPYEELYKERVMSKSIIDTQSEYLYLPSVGDSPRTTSATRPHWAGNEKIVKFKFTENSLDVLEIETDARFQDNQSNSKPVLSIPVNHLSYRCQKNANDECSNKEEENNDIAWEHKDKFQLNVSDIAIQETNFLPIEISNLFEGCYQEIDSNLIGFDIDGNSLNVKIEKTFKESIKCNKKVSNLSDLTFKVAYNYSLVKMNQLVSPDYEMALYPKQDQNTFGFFETETENLTVDNREEEDQLVTMISRWNPKKKVIPYMLTDNFNKPENAAVKEAALKAISVVNQSLIDAGVDLTIQVSDANGKNPGDLRNNTVILVEDPTTTGIIGYGPSTTNPRTGEILNARTVMYLGNVKKYIRSTYDEIVEAKKEAERKKKEENNADGASLRITLAEALQPKAEEVTPLIQSLEGVKSLTQKAKVKSGLDSHSHSHIHVEEAVKELKDSKKYAQNNTEITNEIEALSKHNAYPAALFNFDYAVESGIVDQFDDLPVRPWDELSDTEKTNAMNKLVPYVFIPVMVHELGHNLGLRHNFNGSEDKDRFYSKEELEKKGYKGPMEYSSIMDYAYKNTNELRVMGKYDVAALKFGYARKLELQDGNTIPVQGTLDEMIKQNQVKSNDLVDYMYCTDEHVGLNPGCKRFDEGTSLSGIALHYIQSYHDSYTKRNFRNNRKNFSLMDDPAYANGIESLFFNLRMFFEAYERIQEKYNIPEEIWKSKEPQYAFLNDLYTSMLISAEFFIDVVKTPDIHCAIALKDNATQIVGLEKLAGLEDLMGSESLNCFSPQIKDLIERVNEQNRSNKRPELVIVAETGKSFVTKKDPNSTNSYVDQVDQRGIWMDKLIATQFLFGRKTGMFTIDRVQTNYLHIPEVKAALKDTLDQLINDELTSVAQIRDQNGENLKSADGRNLVAKIGHSVFDTHFIPAPLHSGMNRFILNPLMPPKASSETEDPKSTWFLKEAIRLASETSVSTLHTAMNNSFLEEYSLYKNIPQNGLKLEAFSVLDLAGERYLALPENKVAVSLINKVNEAQKAEEVDSELIENLKLKLDSLIIK